MDLSWAKPLIDVGGWAFAAAVLGTLLWLFVTGAIVPGSVAKAQAEEIKALRSLLLEDVVPPVKEIGKGVSHSMVVLDFLSDFVREVARDRRDREDT